MRKTKKPAIASEWRENKEAQQRADQKAAREQARVARAEAFARFSGAAGYFMIAGGWVVCIALAVLFGLSLATYSPADPGFSVTGTQKAANLCGIVGAWAADFSYWLVGRSAWCCGGARFFRCADGAGVVGSRQYCAVQPSSLVRKRWFCHSYERLCRIGDAAVRLRGRDASARRRWSLRSICGEPSDAIFRNLGLDLPLYAANGRRSVICFWLFLV